MVVQLMSQDSVSAAQHRFSWTVVPGRDGKPCVGESVGEQRILARDDRNAWRAPTLAYDAALVQFVPAVGSGVVVMDRKGTGRAGHSLRVAGGRRWVHPDYGCQIEYLDLLSVHLTPLTSARSKNLLHKTYFL